MAPGRQDHRPGGAKAGSEAAKGTDDSKTPTGPGTGNDGLYIVGQEDERNGDGRGGDGRGRDDKPEEAARAALRADHPDHRPEGPENPLGQDLPEGAYDHPDGEIVDADAFAATHPSPVLAPAPFAAAQEQLLRTQAARAARAGSVDDGKRSPALDAETAAEPADPAKASPAPAPAKQVVRSSGNMLAKDGKPLTLRFILPAGPGSEALRTVGERIAQMLHKVGVQTELTKVADESFFKDHIASGQYDLALYSWPATAYPATDARPIFAKPEPAADGSLLVEQNYTRVGTDHIDQLFDQAAGELDEETARDLMRKADARIWAAAGSIPLYQRPELVAVKPGLTNAGAFGLGAPRYQDIGWKKPAAPKEKNEKKK